MRLSDMPIRRKIMASLLLTSGAVLILTCAAFTTYEIITLRQGLVDGYTTRAKIIASNATAALAFQSPGDAADDLAVLKADARIVEACIYDQQGKIFAQYPAGAPEASFPQGPGSTGYRGGHLDIFWPVVQGDRTLGVVYLQSNLSALTTRYHAYAWLSAAIIASSLFLAFLLSRLLQKQISAPILALAGAAQAVSIHQDFSVRAPKFGQDELGSLTDAFNQMLGRIQEQGRDLKVSEANYREIFEKAGDAIYIHDAQTGRVLDVNERTCELVEATREDVLEGDPRMFITGLPGYSLQDAVNWVRKAATEGPQLFEWRGVTKKGRDLYLEISLKRILIAGQDRVMALVRDISERKKLEEVTKAQDFVTMVLENVPNMIFVKDAKDLKFVMFNKAGEDLIGARRADLIGKSDYDFFPKQEADFFTAKDHKTLAEGKLVEIPEETIQTQSKGRRILHTRKIPVLGSDGKPRYLLGISEDITEQKKQEELRIYAKALEASNKDLQDFIFVASHDLQEPLRKIQAFGNFLDQEDGKSLSATGQDYLKRIRDASMRMSTLLSDLLDLTRITTRAKPFVKVDLNEIVKEVISDLEIRLEETKGKVEAAGLPVIGADPAQMRQLFQNLIANSLKFHKPGETPVIRITAEASEAQDDCRVVFRDNGIGFDPKYAEKIFNIFQRLHGQGQYPGTGIGLAICKKVVERHGGRITAESKEGEGAVFSVTLPLRRVLPAEEKAPDEAV